LTEPVLFSITGFPGKGFWGTREVEDFQMNKSYEETVQYKVESPSIIKRDMLDPIKYGYHAKQDIDITIEQPEYTSVCPMTGLPDFGCITVIYRPGEKIIELKSFKYYLLQYRNVGIFYEHLVNKILEDLVAVLSPKWMRVTGKFTPRGGVISSVSAEYEGEK
jgi:7-cyano-7-deazaguanine reductase